MYKPNFESQNAKIIILQSEKQTGTTIKQHETRRKHNEFMKKTTESQKNKMRN